jgi:YVTN family beta-propeller protein
VTLSAVGLVWSRPVVLPDVNGPESDYWVPAETVTAAVSLGDRVRDIVANPARDQAYVLTQDAVTVIGDGDHIVATIPVSGWARDITVDAAGDRLFVTSYGGPVSVIDIADASVRTIPGGPNPVLAVNPDGAHIYAAHPASDGADSVVSVLTVDGVTLANVPVLGEVTALTVSPDGTRLYAVSADRRSYYEYPAGRLTTIETGGYSVIAAIAIAAAPDSMTVSPDGARLYITHQDMCLITAVDLPTHRVTPIELQDAPLGVAVTPDSGHVYVTNEFSVNVISAALDDADVVVTGDLPRGLRISPDGKRAYVTNFGDRSVSVIDAITNSVTETIEVAGRPEAIAVSASGEKLYVGDYWSGAVTVISTPTVDEQHTDQHAVA